MDLGREEKVRPRRSRRLHRLYGESTPWRLVNGAVLCLFLLVLMLSPLPMGANRDWAWSPFVVAIGAIAAMAAAFSGSRGGFEVLPDERRPLIWLLGSFAFFLLIALLQMSPIAPSTGSAIYYARARDILGHAHAAVPTLAIDASFYTLLRCLACALVFLVARSLFREEESVRALLVALLVSALVVAAYGLYMQVATHNCFVGSFAKKNSDYFGWCLMSGTFVSPNNFACYLGMAVIAAIVLLFGGSPDSSHGEFGDDGGAHAWLSGRNVLLAATVVFCLGGMLISGSRAGFAATVISLLSMGYLLIRGGENFGSALRRMVVATVLIGAIIGLIAGGTLLRKTAYATNNFHRVLIWKAALEDVGRSPLFGWGLGSYTDTYALHQPRTIILPNDKAHSTPIEVLVEMGIPGGIAAMLLVLIPWGVALRGALRRRRRLIPAAAFAVAAVPILHSTVDFSLQIPAIAFVASAFLGVGWAHSFARPAETSDDEDFTEES